MEKLFADYIKEREDLTLIKSENGFLTYTLIDAGLFVSDIFISKDARNQKEGKLLIKEAEDIALENGKLFLFGIVRLSALNCHEVLKIFLVCGAQIYKIEGDGIYLRREIKNNG